MIDAKVFLRDDNRTLVEYYNTGDYMGHVLLRGEHPDLQEIDPEALALMCKEYDPLILEQHPKGFISDLALKFFSESTTAIRQNFHNRRINELDQELGEITMLSQRLEAKRNRHMEKLENLNKEKI